MFTHTSTRLGRLWLESRLVFQKFEPNSNEIPAEAGKIEGKTQENIDKAKVGTNQDLAKLKGKMELKALALAESNPKLVLNNAQNYFKNDWGKEVVALAAKTNPELAFEIAGKSNPQNAEWVMAMVRGAAENIQDADYLFLNYNDRDHDYGGKYWIKNALLILASRYPDKVKRYRGVYESQTWSGEVIDQANTIIRPRELAKARVEAKAKADAKAEAKAKAEAETVAKANSKTPEKPKEPPEPLSKEKQADADEFSDSLAKLGGEKKMQMGELSKKQGEDLAHLINDSWPKHKYDYHARFWGDRDYSWSGWSRKAFKPYVKAYDSATGDKAKDPNVQKAYEDLNLAIEAYPKLVDTIAKELDKRTKTKAENLVRDYDLPAGVTVSNVWTIKKNEYLSDDINPDLAEQQKKLPEKLRNFNPEKSFVQEYIVDKDQYIPDAVKKYIKDPESLNELFSNFFKTPPKKTFKDWKEVVSALDESVTTQAGNAVIGATNWVGEKLGADKIDPMTGKQADLKRQLGLAENEDPEIALGKVNDAILLRNMFVVEIIANKLRDDYKSDLNNALIRLDSEYGNLNPNDKEEVILAKVFGKEGPA